ncbi:hypothetical protein C2S51_038817 [Perilla frutescens var. frutescens]|nr:hypothetical protein C2S51_038817 [Perilla frutescens var. frutescens]
MERVSSALNRAASNPTVVNTFLGVAFCALTARSWLQDQTISVLEAEKEALLKTNKQIKSIIWESKQALYAEASANPQKAIVPLSTLQAIYGDAVTPAPNSGNFTIRMCSIWA